VQKGIPVIPKSVQDGHLQQNIQLTRLSDEDFHAVDQLSFERGAVRFLDPSRHLGFDIFDEENDQPVANYAPWD
jgi:diketogulonate reductase-like aldo/keto reductase